jgi:membrane protease subunit (stomatin/prohibitin family)
VAELFADIDAHNKNIAETQAEIARIQTESAKQAPQVVTATPQQSQPSAAPEWIICPSCSKANQMGTKFCCECGAVLEAPAPQNRFCPECGGSVPAGSKFCGGCGHKFE